MELEWLKWSVGILSGLMVSFIGYWGVNIDRKVAKLEETDGDVRERLARIETKLDKVLEEQK